LLGRVHGDAKRLVSLRLAESGLNLHHYAVLACIQEFAPLSQQQACERLGLDSADMVSVVDHLEAKSLVSRSRDVADRRRYILAVTPCGLDKLAEVDRITTEATDEYFSALTADEVQTLVSLATRVLSAGSEIGTEPLTPYRKSRPI
jgi:DNA-binding MarR family transcriptional regulator